MAAPYQTLTHKPYASAATPPIDRRRRTAGKTILPPVNTTPPPVGVPVVLYYLNNYSYYGWADDKKWMYANYYAMGFEYVVSTPDKKVSYLLQKSTGKVALIAYERVLKQTDVIDSADIKGTILATIEAVKKHDFEGKWGRENLLVDDPYDLLKTPKAKGLQTLNQKLAVNDGLKAQEIQRHQQELARISQMRQGPLEEYRKQLLDHLNSLLGGQEEYKKAAEETGIDFNF